MYNCALKLSIFAESEPFNDLQNGEMQFIMYTEVDLYTFVDPSSTDSTSSLDVGMMKLMSHFLRTLKALFPLQFCGTILKIVLGRHWN